MNDGSAPKLELSAPARRQLLDDMHSSSHVDSDLRRLWTMRLSGQVRRMHTLPVLKDQSVGEHTFNAMHIAARLCWANMLPATGAVIRLLFHDVEEVWTGDVPAHIKRMPGVAEAYAEIDAQFNEVLRAPAKPEVHHLHMQNIPAPGCTKLEFDIAKAADVLELMMSCVEEARRGNREQRIKVMFGRCRVTISAFKYITGVEDLLTGITDEWSELQ